MVTSLQAGTLQNLVHPNFHSQFFNHTSITSKCDCHHCMLQFSQQEALQPCRWKDPGSNQGYMRGQTFPLSLA